MVIRDADLRILRRLWSLRGTASHAPFCRHVCLSKNSSKICPCNSMLKYLHFAVCAHLSSRNIVFSSTLLSSSFILLPPTAPQTAPSYFTLVSTSCPHPHAFPLLLPTYRFVLCLYNTRCPQFLHRIGSPRFSGTSWSQSPHL